MAARQSTSVETVSLSEFSDVEPINPVEAGEIVHLSDFQDVDDPATQVRPWEVVSSGIQTLVDEVAPIVKTHGSVVTESLKNVLQAPILPGTTLIPDASRFPQPDPNKPAVSGALSAIQTLASPLKPTNMGDVVKNVAKTGAATGKIMEVLASPFKIATAIVKRGLPVEKAGISEASILPRKSVKAITLGLVDQPLTAGQARDVVAELLPVLGIGAFLGPKKLPRTKRPLDIVTGQGRPLGAAEAPPEIAMSRLGKPQPPGFLEKLINRIETKQQETQAIIEAANRPSPPPSLAPIRERPPKIIAPIKREPVYVDEPVRKIMENIGPVSTKRTPLLQRVEEGAHELYQNAVNRFHSINRIGKVATKNLGRPLLPGEDPRFLASTYLGVAGRADSWLRFRPVKVNKAGELVYFGRSFDEVIAPMKGNLQELDAYLVARRALNYIDRGIPHGVTDKTTGRILKASDFENAISGLEQKFPQIYQVSEGLNAYNNQLLGFLVDSGRMSVADATTIQSTNKFYVPMRRIFDETADFPASFVLKNNNVFNRVVSPIKKVVGAKEDQPIQGPLDSIISRTYDILEAGERNRVGRSIVQLREISPDVAKLIKPTAVSKPGKTITVYVDGVPQHYNVPEGLLQAMTGMKDEPPARVAKLLQYPTALLRSGATLTPDFAVRNPIRDQWSAMANAKFGYIPPVDFLRGLWSTLAKDKLYWDWQASGGAQSFLVSMDDIYNTLKTAPVSYREEVRRFIRNPSEVFTRLRPASLATKPLGVLQAISELSEKPTRIGVFARARQKGASAIEAGFQSREASTDFARRGMQTRTVNAAYAFFNARLQGGDKLVRSAMENPRRVALTAAAPATSLTLYEYFHHRSNPILQEKHNELPSETKRKYWAFFWNENQKQPVIIPKGDIGAIFATPATLLLEHLEQENPEQNIATAWELFNDVSPVEFNRGGLLPTAIRPTIENMVGETGFNFFSERPLIGGKEAKFLPEFQVRPSTSELAIRIGKALEISPAKVDNFLIGHTAGLGRLGIAAIDEVLLGISGERRPRIPKRLGEQPLFRALLGREPIGPFSKSVNDFYENYNIIMQAESTRKEFPEEREEIDRRFPERTLLPKFDAVSEVLSVKRKLVNKVIEDPALSDEKKRAEIDRLWAEMTKFANDANRQLAELKQRQK